MACNPGEAVLTERRAGEQWTAVAPPPSGARTRRAALPLCPAPWAGLGMIRLQANRLSQMMLKAVEGSIRQAGKRRQCETGAGFGKQTCWPSSCRVHRVQGSRCSVAQTE